MKNKNWDVVNSSVEKIGRFEIVCESVRFSGGHICPYSYIVYPHDGVCVLPILKDGHIAMIKQYRRAVDSIELEMPTGMIDDGEEPQAAASRELFEETGLTAEKLVDCGYINASEGTTSERIYIYFAYCSANSSEQHLDVSEEISVEYFSTDEIRIMMLNNEIHHSAAVALLSHFFMKHI